jgi:hypothetical protein
MLNVTIINLIFMIKYISVLVHIQDFDIFKDKYLIFKFEEVSIQIGMC